MSEHVGYRAGIVLSGQVALLKYMMLIRPCVQDTGRLDTGRLDSGRLDPGRLDPGRLVLLRGCVGRLDSGRLDPGRLDLGRLVLLRVCVGRLVVAQCVAGAESLLYAAQHAVVPMLGESIIAVRGGLAAFFVGWLCRSMCRWAQWFDCMYCTCLGIYSEARERERECYSHIPGRDIPIDREHVTYR